MGAFQNGLFFIETLSKFLPILAHKSRPVANQPQAIA
jgi:hypothetical protein